jgi:ureidoglycolate hydrolase
MCTQSAQENSTYACSDRYHKFKLRVRIHIIYLFVFFSNHLLLLGKIERHPFSNVHFITFSNKRKSLIVVDFFK